MRVALNTKDATLVTVGGTIHDCGRDGPHCGSRRPNPDAERCWPDDRNHVRARIGRGHVHQNGRPDLCRQRNRGQDRRRRPEVHGRHPVPLRPGPRPPRHGGEGDDVPMDVAMNFTFDQVKSGTSQPITPIEAVKGIGPASE